MLACSVEHAVLSNKTIVDVMSFIHCTTMSILSVLVDIFSLANLGIMMHPSDAVDVELSPCILNKVRPSALWPTGSRFITTGPRVLCAYTGPIVYLPLGIGPWKGIFSLAGSFFAAPLPAYPVAIMFPL